MSHMCDLAVGSVAGPHALFLIRTTPQHMCPSTRHLYWPCPAGVSSFDPCTFALSGTYAVTFSVSFSTEDRTVSLAAVPPQPAYTTILAYATCEHGLRLAASSPAFTDTAARSPPGRRHSLLHRWAGRRPFVLSSAAERVVPRLHGRVPGQLADLRLSAQPHSDRNIPNRCRG